MVPYELRTEVMRLVVNELLSQPDRTGPEPTAPVPKATPRSQESDCAGGRAYSPQWHRGGALILGDVAKLVGKQRLARLKSEDGGLKTLLKRYWQTFDGAVPQNYLRMPESSSSFLGYHKITLSFCASACARLAHLLPLYPFLVVRAGKVAIRDWASKDHRHNPKLTKTRMCWFFEEHPDGCPRRAEDCPFAHGGEELQSSPPGQSPQ